jgi:predicted enzyme related to lactoylglutathione lyase
MSGDLRGRFLWYELMTTAPDAAVDFYTSLIGWDTAPFGPVEGVEGEEGYTMWMKGETPVGGLMLLPEEAKAAGAPPHWLAYVGTSDVDATAEQAGGLGANVLVPPTDIPTVGRFAVLQDPHGAVFAIYKPEGDPPPEDEPSSGCFSWHELATKDYAGAYDFYAALFGWEKTDAMDMGEAGVYQMYGRGGAPLGGMYNLTEDMPWPPNWLYYIQVDDVHEAAGRVTELGGQVIVGPMEVPGGGHIAQCQDPQGGMFAMHSAPKEI